MSYLITDILSDPKARILSFGEKNPLVLSVPAAAKTGTTTDWHDNWTIGYTPQYSVGVWVGNNNNKPMRNLTGITGTAPIWNQFFEEFLKDKPKRDFIKPNDIVTVAVCKESGLLDDGICPEKHFEKFIAGTEPKTKSNLHKKVKIDIRNQLLAGDNCPSQFIKDEIFIDYPAQVYSWALANGYKTLSLKYSPLCTGKNLTSREDFLTIIYPKQKTIFETAPQIVNNENIVFEINYSASIQSVTYYLNNQKLVTLTQYPFNYSWQPKIGQYSLYAVGTTDDHKKIKSNIIEFKVIGYQQSF